MQAGTVIAGKYRLSRRLGQGAMGVVWAAINELTERQVALKLIPKWGEENEEVRRRLLREARACGRLNHRNVVEMIDVGQTDEGEPFLVMQLLTGETLGELMKRERKLTQSFAAFIALEVSRALSAAHAAGIIHRDLKPPNVYLHKEPDGEGLTVKVLDFGVSKILSAHDGSKTETGSAIGSPAYMSPEQAKGDRYVDHRTDIWALGVLLFEMLTGKRPFQGETMFTVVADILGGPIPRVSDLAPEVEPGLVHLVSRCIERDVNKRLATADEAAALLKPFVSGRTNPLDSNPFSRAFATGSYPNAAAARAGEAGAHPPSGPRSAAPQSGQGPQRQGAQATPQSQPAPQSAPVFAQPAPTFQQAPQQAAPAQPPQQGGYGQSAGYPKAPQPSAYGQPSHQASYPQGGQQGTFPLSTPQSTGRLRTTLRMDEAGQPTEPPPKGRAALPSMSDAPTAPGQQLPKNMAPGHPAGPPAPPTAEARTIESATVAFPMPAATEVSGGAVQANKLLPDEDDDSAIHNALTSVQMNRPSIPSHLIGPGSRPPAPPTTFGAAPPPPPPSETSPPRTPHPSIVSSPTSSPSFTPSDAAALASLSALANVSAESSVLPSPLSTTSPITSPSTSASTSSRALEIESEPSTIGHLAHARKRKFIVMAAALGGAIAMVLVLVGIKDGAGDEAAQKPIELEGIAPRHNAIAAAARSAAAKALASRSSTPQPAQDGPTPTDTPPNDAQQGGSVAPNATTPSTSPRPPTPRYTPPPRKKKGGGGLPDDPG